MKKFTILGVMIGVILLFNMAFGYSQEDNVSSMDLDIVSRRNNMGPELNESGCYEVNSNKILCEEDFRNFDSRLNNFYLRLLRSKKEYSNNLEIGKTTRSFLEEQELLDNETKERMNLILSNLENESIVYDEFISEVKEVLDNNKEYNYTLLNQRWEEFKNQAKNISNSFKEKVSDYNLSDDIRNEIKLKARNSEMVSQIEEIVKENVKNFNFGKSVSLMNQFKNSNLEIDDVKERVSAYLNGNLSLGRLKQEMSNKIKGASENVRQNIYVNTKQKQIREKMGMIGDARNNKNSDVGMNISNNMSDIEPNQNVSKRIAENPRGNGRGDLNENN